MEPIIVLIVVFVSFVVGMIFGVVIHKHDPIYDGNLIIVPDPDDEDNDFMFVEMSESPKEWKELDHVKLKIKVREKVSQ